MTLCSKNTLESSHASIICAAINITRNQSFRLKSERAQNMLSIVVFICLMGLANAGKKCVEKSNLSYPFEPI